MIVLKDYFAAEQPIIDRLSELTPDHFRHVGSALNVDQVIEQSGNAPAAYLIYASGGITDSKPKVLVETQTWIVAVVARNFQDTQFNTAVRRESGPLLYQVDRCLHGWRPTDDLVTQSGQASTLRATTPPETFQNLPGIGIFLRAYNLSFVNSGQ